MGVDGKSRLTWFQRVICPCESLVHRRESSDGVNDESQRLDLLVTTVMASKAIGSSIKLISFFWHALISVELMGRYALARGILF